MARKPKKKLTAAQRREKKRRKEEFQTIFVNGKQKRVRRAPIIDGMDADEFIRWNADPIWLHQNEISELIEPKPAPERPVGEARKPDAGTGEGDDELPF